MHDAIFSHKFLKSKILFQLQGPGKPDEPLTGFTLLVGLVHFIY